MEAAYKQAVAAAVSSTSIKCHPAVHAVSAMRALYPETKAEIERINRMDNRNASLHSIVLDFLQQTFPSGRSPDGVDVLSAEAVKGVCLYHFTLIC